MDQLFSGLPTSSIVPLNKAEPTRDYPEDFQRLIAWKDQCEILHQLCENKLSPDSVKARAEAYLDDKSIWELNFPFRGADKSVFDGLLVSVNPFAAAEKLGAGDLDLVSDLSKATSGTGLWGALYEQILFPALTKQPGGFKNWRAGAMGSYQFLPLREVAEWLYQCYQTEGDFIVRPCSAGRCMAGYSVESSRLAVQQYRSIVVPAWINGQLLVTHPYTITPQSLWHDSAGDCYRFQDARTFAYAPYFDRYDAKLLFGTRSVGNASGADGTVFVLRE